MRKKNRKAEAIKSGLLAAKMANDSEDERYLEYVVRLDILNELGALSPEGKARLAQHKKHLGLE